MGRYLNPKGWLVSILLISSSQCHAQMRIGYGIKAGAVSASQTWHITNLAYNLPVESRLGYNAGIYIEMINQSSASLLMEVHYLQKGFGMSLPEGTPSFPEGAGEPLTYSARLDYLSIPIMVKARYDLPTITPYILGGVRFEFLVGKNGDGDVVGVIYDQAKSTGIGASLGGGVEVPISNIILLVEVTYSPNFDEVYSGENLHVSNQSMELLLGFRL